VCELVSHRLTEGHEEDHLAERQDCEHGALAAADWLLASPRAPGIHPFDLVVDDLLAAPTDGRSIVTAA